MPYPATDLYPDTSLYPEGVVVTTQSPYTGRLGHPAAQFAAIMLASVGTSVIVVPGDPGEGVPPGLPTTLVLLERVTALTLTTRSSMTLFDRRTTLDLDG